MRSEIVFVDSSNSLHNDKIGGTNSIVRRIIPEFRKAGYNVLFFDLSSREAKAISDCVNEYYLFNSIFQLYNAIKLRHQSLIFDIYLHPWQRIGYSLIRLVLIRKPLSFRKIYFSYPKNTLKRFTSFFDSIITYDRVFVISDRQKAYLYKYYYINSELIYPPVDDIYFELKPKKKQEIFTISWVGRLDKGKGADLLFQIIRNYIDREDVNIKIIAHSVNDANSVITPGWVFSAKNIEYTEVEYGNWSKDLDNMVHGCFLNSDCFVSPYRALESTIDCPMLIQEASAAACLVITEDYPVIRKLLGKTGVLIKSISEDSKKIKAYQLAIDSLLENYASNNDRVASPLRQSFRASVVAKALVE